MPERCAAASLKQTFDTLYSIFVYQRSVERDKAPFRCDCANVGFSEPFNKRWFLTHSGMEGIVSPLNLVIQ